MLNVKNFTAVCYVVFIVKENCNIKKLLRIMNHLKGSLGSLEKTFGLQRKLLKSEMDQE